MPPIFKINKINKPNKIAKINFNFYTRLKIKQKLFLIQLLIILVVCATSLMAIQVTINIFEGILHQESAKVLNLSTVSIENELKQVEEFSFNIISNLNVQKSLAKLKTELSKAERFQEETNLTDILWTTTFKRNITSVNIIDIKGIQHSGGDQIAASLTKRIIPKAIAKSGTMVFIEPFPGDSSLFCARQIREARNPYLSLAPLGILIVRINFAMFVQQSTARLVDKDVNLLIISGKKSIYFSNPLLEKIGPVLTFKGNTGYGVQKVNGKSYFIAYTKSSLTGWRYVNMLPIDNVFKQVRSMRNIVLAVFVLLFLCTVFLSIKLAQHLTQPIEKLSAKMKRVENGEFDIREENGPESWSADEIGALQRDFDLMLQKINALIKEDYTKQILIKDAHLKALQAQINPHFLYNTLESINWLAKVNQQHRISLMVESLGNLLRNAINNQKQVITLQEEIQLVQSYIAIQQTRFEERLEFSLQIAEDLYPYCIPKLTLQPIVENSINYGLEKMAGVCRVSVKFESDDQGIQICIEDNGPGVEADLMNKLRRGVNQVKGSGLGLLNIDERIKLLFGPEYGLSLTSETEPYALTGARVIIRLPKVRVDDVNV